jgi:protoporphyrinogen oxidase
MTAPGEIVVLGAGIAGLSASYHLGHRAVVYEQHRYHGGHGCSIERDGFTWDEGPHISFTANDYVRELFADSVGGEFEQFEAQPTNYFRGHWIRHPVQTSLHEVPEPLRSRCLEDLVATIDAGGDGARPANYEEWLHASLGRVFSDTFPAAYTRKYWTTEPRNLSTDWVGPRMYTPSADEVRAGARGELEQSTYYITTARYPRRGGFVAFTDGMAEGASIAYGKRMERIHFGRRRISFSDASQASYGVLISTLPLPALIEAGEDVPEDVREAARMLRCSELLVVDVAVDHPARLKEQWAYVYDEDKYSTRISMIEAFAPGNAPAGCTGVQVEVYGSAYRPLPEDRDAVGRRVGEELVEMGLVDAPEAIRYIQVRYAPWANVIFDHDRRDALRTVNAFLDRVGVLRAGRFAEWKYLWSDGCVLSGRRVAQDAAEALPGTATAAR